MIGIDRRYVPSGNTAWMDIPSMGIIRGEYVAYARITIRYPPNDVRANEGCASICDDVYQLFGCKGLATLGWRT